DDESWKRKKGKFDKNLQVRGRVISEQGKVGGQQVMVGFPARFDTALRRYVEGGREVDQISLSISLKVFYYFHFLVLFFFPQV
ncbi:hypothetical protein LINPERHAP1_LOCUS13880, partial [Linum perenne]